MALIGTIRKNSWILIVAIGFAMFAFLLMDMLSRNTDILTGGQPQEIGVIDGTPIPAQEFFNRERLVQGGDTYATRTGLWNYFVEKKIAENEADKLGVGVLEEERNSLYEGATISPLIYNYLGRALNNQYDKVPETIKQLEELPPEQQPTWWASLKEEAETTHLKEKLTSLASKGMYTPTWLVEEDNQNKNTKANIQFVSIPYSEVTETIEVTDSDIEKYIKERKSKYTSDAEARVIEYTVFDVFPTSEDSAAIKTEITGFVKDFTETPAEEVQLFVENNYGEMDKAYLTKNELPVNIADTLLSLPRGTVYGPYIDGSNYKLVRLVDRKIIPDSVRARHILIRPDNIGIQAAIKTVDSLKTAIEEQGAVFDTLAAKFGTDGTSATGGDLGFAGPGQMVKPFNDLIFFEAEKGKLYSLQTQYGVHLVEVTAFKKSNKVGAQVAYLSQEIMPSEETQDRIYNQAMKFVQANRSLEAMNAAATGGSVETKSSTDLTKNDYLISELGGGESSRNLIKWAYQAKVGEVSPEIYTYSVESYDSKYVIGGLKQIKPAGLAKAADVRSLVEAYVLNEKKGEIIKSKVSGTDLNAIASQFKTEVNSAADISFDQSFIAALGNEPKVVSAVFSLDPNEVSKPIIGDNGVYVIQLLTKQAAANVNNLAQARKTISDNTTQQVNAGLWQAVKDATEVKDNRSFFW